MLEFKTIESERYKKMEDGIHVKQVGMIKAQDAFNQLKEHLEKVGLLPDEYFHFSHTLNPDTELPNFATAICHTDWGSSEGIYIDIDLKYYDENRQLQFFHLASGKTLGSSADDFLRMSRIAAECSMMLNVRGCRVKVSENQYDNLQLTEHEKMLVAKALDVMGDKVANSEGYSSGEEYWSLADKFKTVELNTNNPNLNGRSAGFVEVYKLVKEARIPNYNAKALDDIRDKYGYDLYKEVLDVVLKEQRAKVFSQMQKAFEVDLPNDIAKEKITPYGFYDFVYNHADSAFPFCQHLKSTLDSLKLSFVDDEFIEMFDNIQSQFKPSLTAQIHAAEAKTMATAPNVPEPTKEPEAVR